MENLNTDKIYAEQLASEYAPKDTTKVMALHKLDQRAKLPHSSAHTAWELSRPSCWAWACALRWV